MTKKKNKLFTFFFSLLPGAGEMYMGFMKLGVSIMGLFFILWSIGEYFDFSLILFLQPIIWFYSFFNVHNINSLPEEEFYALEDHFLFQQSGIWTPHLLGQSKYHKILSYTLLLFGVSVIWNVGDHMLFNILYAYLPESTAYLIMNLLDQIPQLIIGLALITIGYQMLKTKKESLKC